MLDALRISAEVARADYERACDLRYPSMTRGEPVEDLTDLLDTAEELEDEYLRALGAPEPDCRMATSYSDYQRGVTR
jgi:hypothetical protein